MFREIEEFYEETDGNDWSPAIKRAQENFNASNVPGDFRGFALIFGSKDYSFSESIQLIRGMSLTGSGCQNFGGTRLHFSADITGIICHRPATAPLQTPGRGDFSIVERMQLIGKKGGNVTAHGVKMYAPMSLRDVYIEGFHGHGIDIEAGASEREGTNADAWQIYNCRVVLCKGDGLFLKGSDANAGCAIALQCSDNDGWAIRDNSQVGNTFIGCLSHENGRDASGNRMVPRLAFQAIAEKDKAPPRSLFLNCYSEGESAIDAPSTVVGGFMNVKGNAVWLSPTLMAEFPNGIRGFSHDGVSLQSNPPKDPKNQRIIRTSCSLGSDENVAAALELRAYDEQGNHLIAPYQLLYEYWHRGWWELCYARGTGSTPLRFSTKDADVGDSQLWFEQGFYMGFLERETRIRVESGSFPPSSGKYKEGDRIMNSKPIPDDPVRGFAGWICVKTGTPGIWKGYGWIETDNLVL